MVQNPSEVVYEAIRASSIAQARQQLKEHPELITGLESNWLYEAASRDHVPMAQMLVEEFGVDVNWPRSQADSDRPLCAAARHGCLNMARWLLDHGADVHGLGGSPPLVWAAGTPCVEMVQLLLDYGADVNVGGGGQSTPLASAATTGSLAVARLLLARGADPNVLYGTMEYGDPPTNALKQALLFGHQEVAALLNKYGAILPPGCDLRNVPAGAGSALTHIEQDLGTPEPLALHEIIPGDPSITVQVVPMRDCLALVTLGMSAKAMTVPQGAESFQFAELVIYLPADWPLTPEALTDANYSWPIDWLRRIAHHPHDNHTWLGGPSTIIANGDPPKPLAPSTQMTCLLAINEATNFGSLYLPVGSRVAFYTLYPLHTEERNLERKYGIDYLLELLRRRQVNRIVDVHRPNITALS